VLVAACLLAMLTVTALWVHAVLLDTDRFVSATASLIRDPAVQEAVTDALTQRLVGQVDSRAGILGALPIPAGAVANAVAGRAAGRAHDLVLELVSSPGFEQSWERIMRAAHPQVVALLRGEQVGPLAAQNGTVILDLGPVTGLAAQRLSERGLTLLGGVQRTDSGQIQLVLFRSESLGNAQVAVAWLDPLVLILPLATLAAAGLSLTLARDVRTGLLRGGLGLAAAMLILLLLIVVVRGGYLGGIGTDISPQAAADIFDVLARPLQIAAAVLAASGAAIAVAGALIRPARHST
jgi:hypothetical protein